MLLRRRRPTSSRAVRALRAVGAPLALAVAGLTCDATDALRSPRVREVQLRWAGDTVLVAGASLAAVVEATVDGDPYPFPRIAVASSDSSVVAVAGDGVTLRARRLGTATLTARLVSAAVPGKAVALERAVVVVPKAMRIEGAADTLRSLGETVALNATAVDAAALPIGDVAASWASSDTAVAAVSGGGVVTARGDGDATIRAAVAGASAELAVRVRQKAARIELGPGVTLDALGADAPLVASVVDARGNAMAGAAAAVAWESSAPGVATVAGARVTAIDNGVAWARASAGGLRDSVRVEVAQRATRVVIETPGPLALRSVGETVALRARAYDRRDNEVRSALPVWRSLSQPVAYVDPRTGLLTAIAAGEAVVVAELDGVNASIGVAVADVPDRVVVDPQATTLESVGDTLRVRWSVRNARGVEIPGVTVAIGSSDTAVAVALPDGRVIGVGTGTSRVVVSAGTVADTVVLSVINAVAFVDLAPTLVTLASVGDTVVPPVTVRNARGAALPPSAAAWRSANDAVARVTAGTIVARDEGETVVYAESPTYPDRRDSVLVVVTNAPATIQLSADRDTLTAVGQTRLYTAEVRNARGALLTVTPSWRSSDPTVASVSTSGASGAALARAAGTALVIASAGAVADTVVVTVQDLPTSLELTPPTLTIASVGDTARVAASAHNSLGNPIPGASIAWRSTDTTVARALAGGFVAAVGKGTARVIASVSGLADTTFVTVTNYPALIDLARTADTITSLGDTVTLAVTVLNSRGDPLPLTSVTWSVDDPVVARVSATGTVTARDTGSTWVRATGGEARDSSRLVVVNPASAVEIVVLPGGVPAALDTLTAVGQSLSYGATVLNGSGSAITGVNVAWRSTDAAVASVSGTGVVTARGLGAALVIARAGDVEDTVRTVVVDPQRLYVDNSVAMSVRFGTLARPYASIQDAVNAAGVDDTVIVRRGVGYSEAVTLGRRVTLLGDSAAFLAGGRDPLLLPRLRHDLGAAGIAAATPGASYTVRYLAVQHTVDGEAVAIRDAGNVAIEYVYVNPVAGFRTGRGILVDAATGGVLVARARVDSVTGFGVRVQNVDGARVEGVAVSGVGARAGFSGAGVEVSGGTGAVVTGVTVRRTAGPQVLLIGTTDASLVASALTGEQQLVRLSGVLGATAVRGSTLDMRAAAGDPVPVRGGGATDPSGLEVLGSAGVSIEDNVFRAADGATSLMDGVRLQDVRVGATGAAFGARLLRNQFRGGRTAVRSERSTWRMTGSRADSAATAVLLGAADTVTMDSDTLATSRVAAVQSAGAQASVEMLGGLVSGPQRAVVVTGAARAVVRSLGVLGAAGGPAASPALGAVDLDATSIEVAGNSITDVRSFAGLVLRGGSARADSNLVARNLLGVRVGALASLLLRDNTFVDNDTQGDAGPRAGVALVAEAPAVVGANYWGDARGPRRDGRTTLTYGDSVVGTVVYDSLALPILALRGTGLPGAFRTLGGDNQSVPRNSTMAPMAVRVTDAAGRPLAGAAVTFNSGTTQVNVADCGARTCTITTDGSGVATARLDTNRSGTYIVTATVGVSPTVRSTTFTITVLP
ncbi:MAG: Ig-like domain-containing protein [Gemmatimonadaceae bacterium]